MFVDLGGEMLDAEGRIDYSTETLERLRDMLMAGLSAKGYPQRAIGFVLGMSQQTVSQRLAVMPREMRERCAAFVDSLIGDP